MKRILFSTVLTAIAASLTTLAAMHWMGAAHARATADDEYRAQKFVLVNAKGDVRAVLAVGKDDMPVFALVDGAGKVRVTMAVGKDGLPALGMTDSNGKSVVAIAVTKEDDAALSLSDGKGRVQSALSVEGGTGKLTLNGGELTKLEK